MTAIVRSLATAAFIVLVGPAVASASQGPGATGGTATGFEQGLFVAVLVAATCIGLVALRIKRR